MVYRFEELVVWQVARSFVHSIYVALEPIKDFGYKDQIQRAVISIMNNIAEGFQKHKYTKDNKLFINYLNISYGSCGEVKSMLYLAEDLGYLPPEQAHSLREIAISLEYKIEAFITSLQTTPKKPLQSIAKQQS